MHEPTGCATSDHLFEQLIIEVLQGHFCISATLLRLGTARERASPETFPISRDVVPIRAGTTSRRIGNLSHDTGNLQTVCLSSREAEMDLFLSIHTYYL